MKQDDRLKARSLHFKHLNQADCSDESPNNSINGSMVSSAPTTKRPRVHIPSTLFSIYNVGIVPMCLLFGMRKRTKISTKRQGLALLKNNSILFQSVTCLSYSIDHLNNTQRESCILRIPFSREQV